MGEGHEGPQGHVRRLHGHERAGLRLLDRGPVQAVDGRAGGVRHGAGSRRPVGAVQVPGAAARQPAAREHPDLVGMAPLAQGLPPGGQLQPGGVRPARRKPAGLRQLHLGSVDEGRMTRFFTLKTLDKRAALLYNVHCCSGL